MSQLLFKKETIETNLIQSLLAFWQPFPTYDTQSTRAGLLKTSTATTVTSRPLIDTAHLGITCIQTGIRFSF